MNGSTAPYIYNECTSSLLTYLGWCLRWLLCRPLASPSVKSCLALPLAPFIWGSVLIVRALPLTVHLLLLAPAALMMPAQVNFPYALPSCNSGMMCCLPSCISLESRILSSWQHSW